MGSGLPIALRHPIRFMDFSDISVNNRHQKKSCTLNQLGEGKRYDTHRPMDQVQLRAYSNNPAAQKAIKLQAKWSNAR